MSDVKSPQFQTDRRPILTSRRAVLAEQEKVAELADAELASLPADSPAREEVRSVSARAHGVCQRLRDIIQVRTSDERYWITVRRIGASDDGMTFDPSVAGQIAAQERSAVFLARGRARDWLLAHNINIEPDGDDGKKGSVTLRMENDPEWVKDAYAVLRAKFLAGVVGGPSELQRIYDLGFELGSHEMGSVFLRQAVEEVEDFNTVSAKKKSA